MNTGRFVEWVDRLRDLEDDCPWPGPRPLSASETLVGRDTDRKEFGLEVAGGSLVVLSGASGVGKSSFLRAGLIPDLEANGYTVAICDDYSGDFDLSTASGPAVFVASKVWESFAASAVLEGQQIPSDQTLFPFLNSKLGDRAVIVLDQFEELIRHAPTQKMAVFEFIINLHKAFNTKIIVSLRDEYLHELRWIEHRAKGFGYSKFILEDLQPAHAANVVSTVNDDPDSTREIETSAAEAVAAEWRRATGETATQSILDPFGRIGLLHLQAFLYCLDARSAPGKLGSSDVQKVFDDLGTADGQASTAFKSALVEAVDIKLERCRDAAYQVGIDGFLVEGAAGLLARSVTHLSSAGYKLVREATDLFESTIGADLDILLGGSDRGEGVLSLDAIGALVKELTSAVVSEVKPFDLVSASRAEIAELSELRALGDGRLRTDLRPWDADPFDVTCGSLSGLTAEAAIVEEARRFAFAIAWLSECNLVRLSTPAESTTMLSLIHDGFGRALHVWASKRISSKTVALNALTAAPAPSLIWGDDVVGGKESALTIANLRWKGGFVVASFRNVVFVNCDFRGTLFNRCTFEGVTMVNCLLDGTIISDCVFVGRPSALEAPQLIDRAPTFVVGADADYVDQVAAYREQTEKHRSAFFSPLPGAPAVPAELGATGSMEWEHADGGLCFYGGRLSALVLRGSDFSRGGMAIRYAVGSGLEAVELAGLDLEITGSAIRHVALTAPAVINGTAEIDLRVSTTFLGQLWIGQDTAGCCSIENSNVVQAWNEGNVEISASQDSLLIDVGGAKTSDTSISRPTTPADMTDASRRATLRSIDYRRNPAEELHRLNERAKS